MVTSAKTTAEYIARRRRLWERDGGICGFCGEPVPFGEMDIDHRIPRAAGGTDDEDNLRCAHRRCNRAQPGKERRGKSRPDSRAPKDAVTIAVRLPRSLRDRLKKVAKNEYRSLNNQIVVILECAVEPGRPAPERAAPPEEQG